MRRRYNNRIRVVRSSVAIGLTITLCCSGWGCHRTSRSRKASQVTQSNLATPAKSPNQETTPQDGWKRIDVQGAVRLSIPPDMKPTELLGDSDVYREAYRNDAINMEIAYGDFDACTTDEDSMKSTTYTESFLEIKGKKAKLGIDRKYEPRLTIATLCFPPLVDKGPQLHISAMCNGKEALAVAEKIFASVEIK